MKGQVLIIYKSYWKPW